MKRNIVYFVEGFLIFIEILLCGLFLGGLNLLRIIKIKGWNNIPLSYDYSSGVLMTSNHLSMWETFVLNYLFMGHMIFRPRKFFPYGTPDMGNYDKWFWIPFKHHFIFFPRGNIRGCVNALNEVVETVKRKRVVIMFPEGGRTGTNKTKEWIVSPKLHRLRPLKTGAAYVALKTRCEVLPVWVEGFDRALPIGAKFPKFWKPVNIYVGPMFTIEGDENSKEDLEKATALIANKILELADENMS